MEVNFLFWKISNRASSKLFLNFSFEKIDDVGWVSKMVRILYGYEYLER